jgi:peroxiredoxin
MLPLGTRAPDFTLPDPRGGDFGPDHFKDAPVLLVVFMCNHCPYVKHVLDGFLELARKYIEKGVAVIGVNSNDVKTHPDDDPEMMKLQAKAKDYPFPYVFDASQQVAKDYHAACTPDFYVFDKERRLVYRGQMDKARPGNEIPVTGQDLACALDSALEGKKVPKEQLPSMGCNIKWKPGNEPEYYKS